MSLPPWTLQLRRIVAEVFRVLRRRWALAVVLVALGVVGSTVVQVAVVGVVTPPWTLTMVERGLEDHTLPRRRVRSLSRLGAYGPRAFVASEDAKFFLHRGFDWASICKVATSGQSRGASTISQQVAKNVFLWQQRSWIRKGLEVWYTLWLETLLSKGRILELYVNVAETGPAVFGLEAGARHHFDKHARELTKSEAARLAGVLPNPRWSIDGKSAWSRVGFVAKHPAPFPGDKGFDLQLRHFEGQPHGPLSCLR